MAELFKDRDSIDEKESIALDSYTTGKNRQVQEFNFSQRIESHELEQRGNHVVCTSCTTSHAQKIANDEMLIKKEGGYRLIKTQDWNKK